MKDWSFLKKARFSERRFIWLVVAAAAVILAYVFGVIPLVEAKKKADEEIVMKRKVIQKYEEYLQNRKAVEEDLDRTAKQYEALQQKLLPGETPQLGAANLQEIVKRLADKNGIAIRSFKIPEPKEVPPFRKVSIQIDFNPSPSVLSLGQFISDIENHEKGLMISEMDLLVMNVRNPSNIQGSMVISAIMKGSKTKEKGREG